MTELGEEFNRILDLMFLLGPEKFEIQENFVTTIVSGRSSLLLDPVHT